MRPDIETLRTYHQHLAIELFFRFTKENECSNCIIKRKQINANSKNVNTLESK